MISRILLVFSCITMALVCCGAEPDPDEHDSAATPIVKGPTGRPLSLAMQRAYRDWPAADDRDNEFFTNFKYSRLTGIGKDPYVSRRDPSKVIKHDGKYYVWYTRRETVSHPVGIEQRHGQVSRFGLGPGGDSLRNQHERFRLGRARGRGASGLPKANTGTVRLRRPTS